MCFVLLASVCAFTTRSAPPWLCNNDLGLPPSRLPPTAVGKSDPNHPGFHHRSSPDQSNFGPLTVGVRSQSHTLFCPDTFPICYLHQPDTHSTYLSRCHPLHTIVNFRLFLHFFQPIFGHQPIQDLPPPAIRGPPDLIPKPAFLAQTTLTYAPKTTPPQENWPHNDSSAQKQCKK
jgi:hypothetical protein